MVPRVTLIGFGEAGQAFAGAQGWTATARGYDKLTDDPVTRPAKQAEFERQQVRACDTVEAAISDADLLLSLVTADQALAAAQGSARHLQPGALFLDMNSVAPRTKQAAAEAVERSGAHYVDVAIMSPVLPARLAVPLLISGPASAEAQCRLAELGFPNLRIVGQRVGQASAIKMVRSVIVKGIEALTAEAMLAASAAGVMDEVLASLDSTEKVQSWAERADYNLDRMLVHGHRRAAEMEEAVRTLQDLGIDPVMTRGTVERQRDVGALQISPCSSGLAPKIEQIMSGKGGAA
jgi:3-hydroxyisobutyrate dehydrogenase-like beta-hydroxyacid dehydrogenase